MDRRTDGDYCCIVDFRNGIAEADIYLVPTNVVQTAIDEARRYWLSGKRKDGADRKDLTGQRLWLDDRTDGHAYVPRQVATLS